MRATIIKTPDSAPGLLIIDGAQRSFTLQGVWRSALAPALNQTVDVEVDAAGSIVALTAVDPQQLAKERLNQLSGVAQQQGKQAAGYAKKGVAMLIARMGKVAFGGAVVLWVAWFLLPAARVSLVVVSHSFTFWEVLGLDLTNPARGAGSHGLFGLLGVAAIAAPFAAPFLRHRRASWLNAAPLVFLILTAVKIRWQISSALGQTKNALGGMDAEMRQFAAEMTQSAMKSMVEMISIRFGTYVLIAAAFVLAAQVFKKSEPAATVVGAAR